MRMKRFLHALAAIGLVGANMFAPGGLGGAQPLQAADEDNGAPWVVAAPGRVEPKGGMIKIGTAIIGRVADVYVSLNDEVEENELLLKLDDAEARARLAAAETQADVREKSRDDGRLSKDRKDVRKAEDEVYRAERAATGARIELDYALSGRRNGTVTERTLRNSRRRLEQADDRVQKARIKVARAQADPDLPAPTPAEAAVSEARAQVAIAEALLDKTRVRAPRSGRVLILRAKTGEMVAPSPMQPLVVIGDMGGLQVTAEVDEADVAKVEVGQKAYVKSISYPGKEFEGKVAKVAPALAQPVIKQRGARRPTDVEILEVTINLEGDAPLLPGMRVDAFFRK